MSQRVVYLSEVLRFFRKIRREIALIFFLFFVGTFFFVITLSEPQFRAEAIFKKAENQTEEGSSLQSVLKTIRMTSEDSSAISVMGSKEILGKVIEKGGLQVLPQNENKIKRLLWAEFGLSQKIPNNPFRDVEYHKESSFKFSIVPLSEETFEVFDGQKRTIGQGKLGEPVIFTEGRFTLVEMPQKKRALFLLVPKREVYASLKKKIKIKPSRTDGNILHLMSRHHQRDSAMEILNNMMEEFQTHLKKEHQEIANEQVAYLQKRQRELGGDFNQMLDEHVAYLKNALGIEGFLGLSQEIEMLTTPKEIYSAKKHQLDLELKKWDEPKLEAIATHPWQEGIDKKHTLDWKLHQFAATQPIPPEFEGIDLETAEKLYGEYSSQKDQLISQIGVLETFHEKILEPQFELGALSQILNDEVSQKVIQKTAELSLQLADHQNWSEKERERIQKGVSIQKTFLRDHIKKQLEAFQIKQELIQEKLEGLKHTALKLIEQEKSHVEEKLAEIGDKMRDLPEKWRLESELKLKKELILQIIEGLTQLSESKVINHHLFHVKSKPLDWADAPLNIESPHLFLFSILGSVLGGFAFFGGQFFKAAMRGLPVSVEYLQDRKFAIGGCLTYYSETLEKIAVSIKYEGVIAIIGEDLENPLASMICKSGRKVLFIKLDQEVSFQKKEGYDLAAFELPLHKTFDEKLHCWKTEYDCILINTEKNLSSAQAIECLSIADTFVLILDEEKVEDLEPFKDKNPLCVLKN